MTPHDARPTCPKVAAIAGSAVATIVWSTTARNIGSMIEGKTRKNRFRPSSAAATVTEAVGEGSGGTIGCGFRAGWRAWRVGGADGPWHYPPSAPIDRLGLSF